MTQYQNTEKRSAKRYPYLRSAQCEVDGEIYEAQLMNISASGVQFATRSKIDSEKPVRLKWKDTQFGAFDLTLVAAREAERSENKEFKHFYGMRYYSLSPEMKDALLVVLKHFRMEEKQANQVQAKKVTPEYLYDIIKKGPSFLREAFKNPSAFMYFENIFREISDYEKDSFSKEDELSLYIQRLTSHVFHCNLLGITIPMVVESPDRRGGFFNQIVKELNSIKETESESDMVFQTVQQTELPEEEKKELLRKFNESNNRLFYTKQGLVQSVCETFNNIDAANSEYKLHMERIMEEHEQMLEFLNSSTLEEGVTYDRRTLTPSEEKKVEEVVDIPVMTESKVNYLVVSSVLLLMIFLTVVGVQWYFNWVDLGKIKDTMELGIPIQKFERMESQVNIRFRTEDWTSLSPESKAATLKKIAQFINADKFAKSALVYDGEGRVLTVVYDREGAGKKTR